MFRFLVLALALTVTSAFSPASHRPIVSSRRATVTMKEAAAKAVWLAKLDAPTFGGKVIATNKQAKEDEAKAKAVWLSQIDNVFDTSTWGQATKVLSVVEEAMQVQGLANKCESGNTAACVELSKEEEAKRRWLASIDVPTWGMIAKAAEQASAAAAAEASAKEAWLAKLDTPTWGKAAAAVMSVASEAAMMQALTDECASGVTTACDSLATEDAAKKAWLAKLDVPSWGAAAKAMSHVVAAAPSASEEEAAAKAAWLAKIDQQAW